MVLRGLVDEKQIVEGVERAKTALAPDVVRINHNLGEDWAGGPSVFFRILITDEAAQSKQQRELIRRIGGTILKEVKPDELGLQPYFNYRTVSEQAELKEPSWE